jgi:hypothetical protein
MNFLFVPIPFAKGSPVLEERKSQFEKQAKYH